MKKKYFSLNEFCHVYGIGRTTAYRLIGSGSLETIKIGARRLISVASAKQLANRQADQGESS